MAKERVSLATGVDLDAALDDVAAALTHNGVVVLDHLADPALIARCRAEVEAKHPDMTVVDRERNYGPYEGRHLVPMRVEDLVADRAIFLPKPIEKIAARMLGGDFLMDSLGLLVSAPGAPDQPRHPDGRLFPGTPLDRLLPAFALAFSLPLVRMDEVSGTTAFWLGSHRNPNQEGPHDFAPVVDPGSALLWDFRTWHGGLANRGDRPRPIIYSVLSREWWVEMHPPEATRYEKLLVARSVHASLSPRLRHRINRARLVD